MVPVLSPTSRVYHHGRSRGQAGHPSQIDSLGASSGNLDQLGEEERSHEVGGTEGEIAGAEGALSLNIYSALLTDPAVCRIIWILWKTVSLHRKLALQENVSFSKTYNWSV